jgi:hypothetical protein
MDRWSGGSANGVMTSLRIVNVILLRDYITEAVVIEVKILVFIIR